MHVSHSAYVDADALCFTTGPVPRKKPTLQEAEPVRKSRLQNGLVPSQPVSGQAQQKLMAPLPQPRSAHAPAPAGAVGNR